MELFEYFISDKKIDSLDMKESRPISVQDEKGNILKGIGFILTGKNISGLDLFDISIVPSDSHFKVFQWKTDCKKDETYLFAIYIPSEQFPVSGISDFAWTVTASGVMEIDRNKKHIEETVEDREKRIEEYLERTRPKTVSKV